MVIIKRNRSTSNRQVSTVQQQTSRPSNSTVPNQAAPQPAHKAGKHARQIFTQFSLLLPLSPLSPSSGSTSTLTTTTSKLIRDRITLNQTSLNKADAKVTLYWVSFSALLLLPLTRTLYYYKLRRLYFSTIIQLLSLFSTLLLNCEIIFYCFSLQKNKTLSILWQYGNIYLFF